jgi:hypothetical protein
VVKASESDAAIGIKQSNEAHTLATFAVEISKRTSSSAVLVQQLSRSLAQEEFRIMLHPYSGDVFSILRTTHRGSPNDDAQAIDDARHIEWETEDVTPYTFADADIMEKAGSVSTATVTKLCDFTKKLLLCDKVKDHLQRGWMTRVDCFLNAKQEVSSSA